jgi:hypothetical protein
MSTDNMTFELTYYVDLCHGVDEDDGEDGDGQPEKEGPAQVPNDATQPRKKIFLHFQKMQYSSTIHVTINIVVMLFHLGPMEQRIFM